MHDSHSSEERIFIVIPVLNRWNQTRICLQHIESSTYKNVEIIVVDHGSTDETEKALHELYPDVTHIRADGSLWWTGATNIGIREAMKRGARVIMLLNNDCYVEPDTLRHLTTHAASRGEAIIAPLQRSLQSGRTSPATATTCFLLGFSTLTCSRKLPNRPGADRLASTSLIIGGRGALIPTSAFERVGLLDEIRLPHYGSDHDFYLRCRKHGIPLYIATDAYVDIDEKRTTLASRLGGMNVAQFVDSLTNPRSHRNLKDLSALFKKHYPIKGLYLVGVALNMLRYFATYLYKRLAYLLYGRFRHC